MASFRNKTKPELTQYLKARGISCSGKNKPELIPLCEAAEKIPLQLDPDLCQVAAVGVKEKAESLGLPGPADCDFKPINNIMDMPHIGLYDIFNYLLETRADFDGKKLKAFKSSDDYRLFGDGHVQDVQICLNGDHAICKAEVKPTQRDKTYLKKDYYTCWVFINKTSGTVCTAHCECKGGFIYTFHQLSGSKCDGACRHVAAVLYDLESYCDKLQSCTDIPMPWVRRCRTTDEPVEIAQLTIRKIQYGDSGITDTEPETCFDVRHPDDRGVPTKAELDDFCSELKKVDPMSCCISALAEPYLDVCKSPAEDADTDVVNDLTAAHKIKTFIYTLGESENDARDVFDMFVTSNPYTEEELSKIEEITRGQSKNKAWSKLRIDRVTASKAYRVHTRLQTLTNDPTTDPSCLLKELTSQPDNLSHVKSIEWGITREPKARKKYAVIEGKRHKHLDVQETGLHISPLNPLFACSPDGIVSCRCKSHATRGNTWLVEIKCPSKGKDMEAKVAAEKFCGVECSENGIYRLKEKHSYYAQIQVQLGILKLDVCDLVVYTKKGLYVLPVWFCKESFDNFSSAARSFSAEHLFPEIVKRECSEIADVEEY